MKGHKKMPLGKLSDHMQSLESNDASIFCSSSSNIVEEEEAKNQ